MTRYAGPLLFAATCLALAAHFTWFFYGYFGFDDLYYAELATDLYRGKVDGADHYSYRLLPLALTGLSYAAFGVGDLSSALPTLALSVVILYALYRCFRREPWALALAYGFYFSLSWNLFYADKPMPDVYVSAFCFLAWLAHCRMRLKSKEANYGLGALTAVMLFLAFNSKGTVLLIAPLFLVYFLRGVTMGRWRYWAASATVGGGLLVAYFCISWWLTGDPLARFTAIDGNHYLNPCSYDQASWAYLFERLTSGFAGLMGKTHLFLHAIVAGLACVVLRRAKGQDREHARFAIGTIFFSFAIMNFMTISTNSYNPVCLDPRHILLFSPIMTVCSVWLIRMMMARRFEGAGSGYRLIGAVAVALAMAYPSYQLAKYSTTLKYAAVKDDYHRVIHELPKNAAVYGSPVTRNYGRYFTGFSQKEYSRFADYNALPDCSELGSAQQPILLKNWYMDWHAGASSERLDSLLVSKRLRLERRESAADNFEVFLVRCADD